MSATEADFADYFRQHHPDVVRFVVRRINDREVAMEIASDVFRITWRAHRERELPDRGWLFATARNLIGNEYRRRKRVRALVEKAAASVIPDNPTDDDGRIAAVLERLPERHAEVLRLAYWDELSGEEMATVLGCSTNAVWIRLTRARSAAQKILEVLDA